MGGKIERVFYCLPAGQRIEVPDFIKNDKQVTFLSGMPNFEELGDDEEDEKLVILDDFMTEIDENVLNLFIRNAHHKRISVIFLVQNLFYGNKLFRTISLQSNYFFIMRNLRDKRQIQVFANQVCPENSKFIAEAYKDATREPFTYLFFDLSQGCNEKLRIRTNILPTDKPQNIVYVSKSIEGRKA